MLIYKFLIYNLRRIKKHSNLVCMGWWVSLGIVLWPSKHPVLGMRGASAGSSLVGSWLLTTPWSSTQTSPHPAPSDLISAGCHFLWLGAVQAARWWNTVKVCLGNWNSLNIQNDLMGKIIINYAEHFIPVNLQNTKYLNYGWNVLILIIDWLLNQIFGSAYNKRASPRRHYLPTPGPNIG